MTRYGFIFVLLVVALVIGCNDQNGVKKSQARPVDTAGSPDSEVRGARIVLYDQGMRTTEIEADRILQFDAIDSTMAYGLDIDFLDSAGMITSNLVGDSGIIRERTGRLEVFGNVVVITSDSAKLETEHLTWNPVANQIQTDAYVEVTRDGDLVTGWGLEADKNLHRIKILRQVSGTIQDPKLLTD